MSQRQVALTFDAEHPDRPAEPGTCDALVDRLAAHRVRATFFVQGRWAAAYPATTRRIATDGHLVGSHSHYHAQMHHLNELGIAQDLSDAATAIEAAGGVHPRPWFRCPFGAGTREPAVRAALAAAGYRHVGWHVEVEDWDPVVDADAVVDGVVRGVHAHGDGAVVLLHAWPTATLDAIDRIVERLRADGMELCRIDDLADVPEDVPEDLPA